MLNIIRFILSGVIVMQICSCQQKTPEKRFWDWFILNSDRLYEISSGTEPIAEILQLEFKKIHPSLTFEVSVPKGEEKKEFIISANGDESAFEAVIKLFNAKPELSKWEIKAFRQRKTPTFSMTINGLVITAKDVKYLLIKDNDPLKMGILLFIPGFTEEKREDFVGAGFVFLDGVLGEYDVETKVGRFDVFGMNSEFAKNSKPIDELTNQFDEYFKDKTD
jgi:hypothetical protein